MHGKTLPPGDYTFSDNASVLLVRGSTGGAVNLTNRRQSSTAEEAKVVFEKDGDDYILKEAWMGDGTGRELLLPKSNGERRRAYSALSATAGSTRVARRAGSAHAIALTARRITGTAANVTASAGSTP